MSDATSNVIFAKEIEIGRDRLMIEVKNWKGRYIFNARRFWPDSTGEFKPGKQGLSFAVDKFPTVVAAINEALAKAKAEGIIS